MITCECGCGQPTSIARLTNARWGHVAGQPTRFARGHRPRPEQESKLCDHCGESFSKYGRRTWGKSQWQAKRFCSRACSSKSRSVDPIERFWVYVDKTPTCWLWTGSVAGRYGIFRPVASETMVRAHRYSWEISNGPIPDGLGALHNCPGGDNPLCVNPAHLFLGTQLDNMSDCSRKGRMPRGEQRSSAKLTVEDVRRIRNAVRSGQSMQSLAREFGVSGPTVQSIVHRRKWAWVA